MALVTNLQKHFGKEFANNFSQTLNLQKRKKTQCQARIIKKGDECQCPKKTYGNFCTHHSKVPKGGTKWVRKKFQKSSVTYFVNYNWEVFGRVDQEFTCKDQNDNIFWKGKRPFFVPCIMEEMLKNKYSNVWKCTCGYVNIYTPRRCSTCQKERN